ncbi:MAG: hypothetical protein R3E39_14175 [Anaerolineae bacterium]
MARQTPTVLVGQPTLVSSGGRMSPPMRWMGLDETTLVVTERNAVLNWLCITF